MIVPEHQALGTVLPKRPKGCADPLAERLQRFNPGSLLGGVDADTRRRAMIDREKNGPLPVFMRVGRRHIRAPPRLDPLRDNRPIVGFGAMWMALPRGGQQLVRTPQAQDPAR
jgi:hypothetical protein